jgi:hypothetical protein
MSQLRTAEGEERPLQGGDRSVNGALTPARHPRESILGGTAEGGAVWRRQLASQTGNQRVAVKIINRQNGLDMRKIGRLAENAK